MKIKSQIFNFEKFKDFFLSFFFKKLFVFFIFLASFTLVLILLFKIQIDKFSISSLGLQKFLTTTLFISLCWSITFFTVKNFLMSLRIQWFSILMTIGIITGMYYLLLNNLHLHFNNWKSLASRLDLVFPFLFIGVFWKFLIFIFEYRKRPFFSIFHLLKTFIITILILTSWAIWEMLKNHFIFKKKFNHLDSNNLFLSLSAFVGLVLICFLIFISLKFRSHTKKENIGLRNLYSYSAVVNLAPFVIWFLANIQTSQFSLLEITYLWVCILFLGSFFWISLRKRQAIFKFKLYPVISMSFLQILVFSHFIWFKILGGNLVWITILYVSALLIFIFYNAIVSLKMNYFQIVFFQMFSFGTVIYLISLIFINNLLDNIEFKLKTNILINISDIIEAIILTLSSMLTLGSIVLLAFSIKKINWKAKKFKIKKKDKKVSNV